MTAATDDAVRLTGRELEIAQLVATGLPNELIAALLHISPRTVQSHLRKMYAKTGSGNRAGLCRWLLVGTV
jgi:DNA-binding CsgD family transcriptional regulator